MQTKLGLYGGSFDPPHYGHLRPVATARQVLGLDRVLYLPTAYPPHKRDQQQAPPHARYTMVELALLGEEGMLASPYEMAMDGVSYTVETLEHFRRAEPASELHLLIGADSFLELSSWHRWRELTDLARLAVLPRPGCPLRSANLPTELAGWLRDGRALVVEEAERLDISSTEVRECLSRGGAGLDELLPPLVITYIQKYELYHREKRRP